MSYLYLPKESSHSVILYNYCTSVGRQVLVIQSLSLSLTFPGVFAYQSPAIASVPRHQG